MADRIDDDGSQTSTSSWGKQSGSVDPGFMEIFNDQEI